MEIKQVSVNHNWYKFMKTLNKWETKDLLMSIIKNTYPSIATRIRMHSNNNNKLKKYTLDEAMKILGL